MNEFNFTWDEFWVETIRRMAATIVKKAIVTIEGEEYDYPIVKTVILDGFLKHYIEIEDEPVGSIEKVVLVNENGVTVGTGTGLIEKNNEGWQLAFKAFILIKEEQEDDDNAG